MNDMVAMPLADVLTARLGPPGPRRGGGGSRRYWHCPLHPDRNPSLTLTPDGARWKCFQCGESGDAISLVRCMDPQLSFQQAVQVLGGNIDKSARRKAVEPRLWPKPMPHLSDAWARLAESIAAEAETHLQADIGTRARRYLAGRGLSEETIREAGLGYWPSETTHSVQKVDGPIRVPRGITIPWRDGGQIRAINMRRPVPPGEPRKYHMVRGSRRSIYPDRTSIVPGQPLVLAEGEFDALLLGQELKGMNVSVITLGSAGDTVNNTELLSIMASASPWYVSSDADAAGSHAAGKWLSSYARCRRASPPENDWTDSHLRGYNLQEWWSELLAGRDPARFDPSWYEPFGGVPRQEDEYPVIVIPTVGADAWRWVVANWPAETWLAWRRLATELTSPGADAGEIHEADHQAFLRVSRTIPPERQRCQAVGIAS